MEKINLNLIPGAVCPVVNVSQYDEGRQFQLAVFHGSAPYDLTGKTVIIEVGKTDGNGCAYGVSDTVNGIPVVAVSGNIVTITTPVQMTACAGDNMSELKISDSNADLGTLNFILLCEAAPLSPDTPISETEIPAIIDAAEANADRAEAAVGHYPYIDDDNKHWMVWDVENGEWVDTGIVAQGSGGTMDYTQLNNKPSINNVTLSGNKSASDLSLASDSAMTGATSSTAGTKGLVPAPAIGDQTKFLCGDGTWQTAGGGGSSSLAGLSDVTITSPTNSQPLTYDNVNSKWVNGGVIPTANGGTGNADGYIRTGLNATYPYSGQYSTQEGQYTYGAGSCSHAEGQTTEARGDYSHSEGRYTKAIGNCSHASGIGTKAEQNYQFVIGRYNKNKTDTAFEIGNGTNALPSPTHNLMEVYKDGRIVMDEADALVSGGNLAAIVELTRTMTAQRAAGSYVFVVADQKTYYIDTTISATETLNPGTNATEVTVFGQISSLNSDLTDYKYIRELAYPNGYVADAQEIALNDNPFNYLFVAFIYSNQGSGVRFTTIVSPTLASNHVALTDAASVAGVNTWGVLGSTKFTVGGNYGGQHVYLFSIAGICKIA